MSSNEQGHLVEYSAEADDGRIVYWDEMCEYEPETDCLICLRAHIAALEAENERLRDALRLACEGRLDEANEALGVVPQRGRRVSIEEAARGADDE